MMLLLLFNCHMYLYLAAALAVFQAAGDAFTGHTYTPPAHLLVDFQGTIERSGPRQTPDPATTTSTHHHRQLIVTRPAPNGLLRSEKETKTPYGPLSPPDSASPTNSHSPGVCCWPAPRLVSNLVCFCASRSAVEGPFPRP